MKKQVVSFILALSTACSLAIPAGAAGSTMSTESIKIETSHMTMINNSHENQEALSAYTNAAEFELEKNSSRCSSNEEPYLNFSVSLEDTDIGGANMVCATGTFRVAGQEHAFNVSGEANRVFANNGDSILVGSLVGSIDQGEEITDILSMTLCYNETTGEYFVPLCIGTYGIEDNPPLLVEFGESFNGLAEAVTTLSKERERGDDLAKNIGDASETSVTIMPRAVDPSPMLLNSTTTTSNNKNVMYTYLYGGKEAYPSGLWQQTVKTQVHLTNFKNGYINNLGSNIARAEGFYLSSVLLNYYTSKTSCDINDPKPYAQSSTVSLIAPTFLIPSGLASYLASYVEIPISVKGVSHTFSNNYSKIQTKIWSSSNIEKAITTSASLSDAATTTKGVSVDMKVFNALTAGNSVIARCNSVAVISFVEVTTGSEIVPRTNTISSNWIAYSLLSKT